LSVAAIHKVSAVIILCLASIAAYGQSVTRTTFRSLEEVQVMMEENRYEEALVVLEALSVETVDNPYDFALTSQYLAHVSVLLDDSVRAQTALQAALANDGIPPDIRSSMNLFYGTVLLSNEEYELALDALEEWYSLAELPLSSQVFSLAYANYQNGNLERAAELIDEAIGNSKAPQVSWYQLQYRILFDQKEYQRAETVLKILIDREPANVSHWRMLASHYLQLEESNDGLAALMVANANELIESESDLRQIVSLWGYIDAPEKGARILTNWIDEGLLEAEPDTLKQLGNLWMMARERENALSVLTEAAKSAPDGKTYELLGGIYFEGENWDLAYAAYQEAIRLGDLEEPLRISLLAGICAFRAGNYDEARPALEAAAVADDEELRQQAEQILLEIR
jgi:tetratricopeptide (TPR) repeat protein